MKYNKDGISGTETTIEYRVIAFGENNIHGTHLTSVESQSKAEIMKYKFLDEKNVSWDEVVIQKVEIKISRSEIV